MPAESNEVPKEAIPEAVATRQCFEEVLDVITKIKNAGNLFYKPNNYQKAVQKYKKSCRYIQCLSCPTHRHHLTVAKEN